LTRHNDAASHLHIDSADVVVDSFWHASNSQFQALAARLVKQLLSRTVCAVATDDVQLIDP